MCNQRINLPSRSLYSLWLIYSLACAVCVQTDNIVLQACVRQLCDACFGRGADTALDSHKRRCPRAGGLEEPLIPHLFTLHNWMQRGALQQGGLDGTGRKMDEVSSTFTSAALLHADFVLIQEYHTYSPSAPTYCNSELSHFYWIQKKMTIFSDTHALSSVFIGCLCKLTETQMQFFLKGHWASSVFNQYRNSLLE